MPYHGSPVTKYTRRHKHCVCASLDLAVGISELEDDPVQSPRVWVKREVYSYRYHIMAYGCKHGRTVTCIKYCPDICKGITGVWSIYRGSVRWLILWWCGKRRRASLRTMEGRTLVMSASGGGWSSLLSPSLGDHVSTSRNTNFTNQLNSQDIRCFQDCIYLIIWFISIDQNI